MNMLHIRQQLHKRIDNLPDDVIEEISDFTLFIMAKKKMSPAYEDWTLSQWQDFALPQFFREDDDVEHSLADTLKVKEKP